MEPQDFILGPQGECPNCGRSKFYTREAHGFTADESPVNECDCGEVWRVVKKEGGRIDVMKEGKKDNDHD